MVMAAWREVNRQFRCPVCHKDHWCTHTDEVVLCMRVPGGKEVPFRDGQLGYLYRLNGEMPPERFRLLWFAREKQKPSPDMEKLHIQWHRETAPERVEILSKSLGLPISSLVSLQAAYAKERGSYAFPMRDGSGKVIGIRLRTESGFKFAVTGSRNGIFIPATAPQKFALCVEGPTSCAAGIALGYYTIGRASDRAGTPFMIEAVRRLGIRRIVLVADNKIKEDGDDDSGLAAAQSISAQLPVPSAVCVLPAKDLRQFLNDGGTAQVLESIMGTLVYE